jgi:hypothetical protein
MALVVTVGLDMVPQAHKMRDHVRAMIGMNIIIEWDRAISADDDAKTERRFVCFLAHDTESPQGSVILNDVQATVSPAAMVVVLRIMSVPEVPTLPCAFTVPAPFLIRKCAAVIGAAALVSEVMAFAVAVARPLLVALVEAAKAVALIGKVAPSVPLSAVSVVAGWAPERMYRLAVPPVLNNAVSASNIVLVSAIAITGRSAMLLILG